MIIKLKWFKANGTRHITNMLNGLHTIPPSLFIIRKGINMAITTAIEARLRIRISRCVRRRRGQCRVEGVIGMKTSAHPCDCWKNFGYRNKIINVKKMNVGRWRTHMRG
jgi:hypothetical protein